MSLPNSSFDAALECKGTSIALAHPADRIGSGLFPGKSGRQVVGVIRLTQSLANVYSQFLRLRSFVAGILGIALVPGSTIPRLFVRIWR